MKKLLTIFSTITLLGLVRVTQGSCNGAPQVYDLAADWSATQNPNGPWSYRQGNALLVNSPIPWVGIGYTGSWNPPAVAAVHKISGTPWPYQAFLGTDNIHFFQNGDLLLVPSNGGNVLWTAPASGTINISGNAWPFQDNWNVCDPDDNIASWWTIAHNGSIISDGGIHIENCGNNARNSPTDFLTGSGGAGALQNISVAAGDQIVLAFSGMTVVVNFKITLTTASLDPVTAIENLAITVAQMNLQNGIANSLDAKLDTALGVLTDINANNDAAACNSLAAFISAVEAQRSKKITNTQADQLIASARDIKACLNCSN